MYKTIIVSLFLAFIVTYMAVLSSTGFVEKKTLEAKLKNLKAEVERLEIENRTLESRHHYLKSDEKALAMEARKHYYIPNYAKIIKFIEPDVTQESSSVVFGDYSKDMTLNNVKQLKTQFPPMSTIKVFYILTVAVVGIGLFIKLKN